MTLFPVEVKSRDEKGEVGALGCLSVCFLGFSATLQYKSRHSHTMFSSVGQTADFRSTLKALFKKAGVPFVCLWNWKAHFYFVSESFLVCELVGQFSMLL